MLTVCVYAMVSRVISYKLSDNISYVVLYTLFYCFALRSVVFLTYLENLGLMYGSLPFVVIIVVCMRFETF